MLKEGVSQRLRLVREHLSERLGEDITATELARRLKMDRQIILRMENGLRGTIESLILVLRYYHQHGYNPVWILEEQRQDVPMILSTGQSLVQINETLMMIKASLESGQSKFEEQLNRLGFQTGNNQILPAKEEEVALPHNPI